MLISMKTKLGQIDISAPKGDRIDSPWNGGGGRAVSGKALGMKRAGDQQLQMEGTQMPRITLGKKWHLSRKRKGPMRLNYSYLRKGA